MVINTPKFLVPFPLCPGATPKMYKVLWSQPGNNKTGGVDLRPVARRVSEKRARPNFSVILRASSQMWLRHMIDIPLGERKRETHPRWWLCARAENSNCMLANLISGLLSPTLDLPEITPIRPSSTRTLWLFWLRFGSLQSPVPCANFICAPLFRSTPSSSSSMRLCVYLSGRRCCANIGPVLG